LEQLYESLACVVAWLKNSQWTFYASVHCESLLQIPVGLFTLLPLFVVMPLRRFNKLPRFAGGFRTASVPLALLT